MTKRNFILLLTYLICSVIILTEFGIDTAFKISIVMLVVTLLFLVSCLCVYLGVLSLKEAREEKKDIGIDKRPIIEQLNEYFGVKEGKD